MGGCADYTDTGGKVWEGVLIIPTLWEGLGGCADYTDIMWKVWEGVLIIPTLVETGRVC